MTKFAIVDLETTGHAPAKGDQIIEIGIVIVEDGHITEQYSSYVQPNLEIPAFITGLTGITDEKVQDAPKFNSIIAKIRSLCKDAYFVAHHVQFDLGFLNEALYQEGEPPIRSKVIDTVELARIFAPRAPGYKLSQLADHFHIEHQAPHRALSDAYVTAELLIRLLEKGKSLPVETLEQLIKFEPKLKSDMHNIMSNWIEEKKFQLESNDQVEVYRGIAIKKIDNDTDEEEPTEITDSFGHFLDDTFGETGALQKLMYQYERRAGQKDMAEFIFHAFHEQKHALIEAETGTGKTLGYVLPAVYFALKEQTKVVVSTYTTQLQSQLLEKEIPLMQRLFSVPVKAVVLKGKSHYLSLNKFEQEIHKPPTDDNYDVVLTKSMILVWLTETETGDVDEIHLPSSGKLFWRKINAEAEHYLDPKSPWFSRTFFQRVKRKAQKSNIIVTNHALLCTDMINDFQLLPSYDYIILDEAHHFDKTASKHFGLQLDYVSTQFLLNGLLQFQMGETIVEGDEFHTLCENAKSQADDFFRFLFEIVAKQQTGNTSMNDVGRIQFVYEHGKLQTRTAELLADMTGRFVFTLKEMERFLIKHINQFSGEKRDTLTRKLGQIETLIRSIEAFFLQNSEQTVKWIEIESLGAKNAVFLYCEPLNVGQLLAEQFYNQKKSVVLTSATLTMKGSFDFLMERNGLDESETNTKKIPSPFNFEEQVRLLVPSDLPDIQYGNEDDYVQAVSYSIYELAKITNGRMLVLFTSYKMLRQSYEMLRQFTDQDDFVIIAQGISSGSRTRLKKNFQSFDQAILLGTSSFWEGVDIPGESLSAVVIVKLPFEPPNHPVYSAKAKHLKTKGKNPFMSLALPNAVIRFKQGFGRLIRTKTDRGIVMVCDQRILKTKYGKYFTESIPKVPIVYNDTEAILEEADKWF
nr:ATP-dependent DNA helicase DinG [Salirhabdus salicampi]